MTPVINSDIIPVIYLGFNRNGTTWLGNIMKENFKISSVSHELHYGILESSIYFNRRYFKDIGTLDKYIRFIRLFSGTDFFLVTGLSERDFYASRHTDFYSFFFDLMDKITIKENSLYWTTKLDPAMFFDSQELNTFLMLLKSRYKKIKFISVQREMFAVLKSGFSLRTGISQAREKFHLLWQVFYAAQYRYVYNQIQKRIKAEHGLDLKYEEMVDDIDAVVERIKNYIEAQRNIKDTSVRLIRNTSYQKNNPPKEYNQLIKRLIAFLSYLFVWPVKMITLKRYKWKSVDPAYWRIIK